jgi:hypothetical protein
MSIATEKNDGIASNLIGLDDPHPGTFPPRVSEAEKRVAITPAPLDFSFLTVQSKNLRWFPKNGHDIAERFSRFIQPIQLILKALQSVSIAGKCPQLPVS